MSEAAARVTGLTGDRATGNLEYAFVLKGVGVLAGWSSAGDLGTTAGVPMSVYRYPRADANATVGLPAGLASGFVCLLTPAGEPPFAAALESARSRLREAGVDGEPGGLADFADDRGHRFALLKTAVDAAIGSADRSRLAMLDELLPAAASASGAVDSPADAPIAVHVDECLLVEAAGLLVVSGWTRRDSVIEVSDGAARASTGVAWVPRVDVMDGVGPEYSGFVASARLVDAVRGELTLMVSFGGEATEVSLAPAPLSSQEPLAVARALFAIPTHPRGFMARLDAGEGEVMAALIRRRNEALSHDASTVIREHDGRDITLSVIVPLYRRYDLLWNQFLSWSRSPNVDRVEFVLVNDDPRSETEFAELVDQMQGVFDLNITLVLNHVNRGYATANNVGARVARGSTLLLLNSDALLDTLEGAFAAQRFLEEHPDTGLVGAVIYDADRLVVHTGLSCAYLPSRSSWFNYHPGTGTPLAELDRGEWWPVDAVTGAVMVMRTADFRDVGGLTEDFLIGDYEDSDLCWRLRQRRMGVVVSNALRARHSERTSMAHLGDDEFREKVSLFNSWLHARRWGKELDEMFGSPDGVPMP